MKKETNVFGLVCRTAGAPAPVLAGVRAIGRLDGVLFELTLRQTYRNTSDRVLEVVYTFPLPHQAVLLGFASELNGERKVGTIVARHDAERQYEEALAGGDAPVMLETLADRLHTANIGNLKPNDEMVLEVRFAQLLAFEQGRLRLAIPTTIAPRFGQAELAGLQPQQVPQASLDAEYPLALSVTVVGTLAGAALDCPTHPFTREAVEGGVRLDLTAESAWLDRDVVILITPNETWPSLVIQAHDTVSLAAPVVVMAALQPPRAVPRERIALKLLVDCSGSMAGDSIASARAALKGALAGLEEQDHVSASRFGSTVEHLFAPTACTPHALRHLKLLVGAIHADLGGTEMQAALKAVFALPVAADSAGADVLLVTDGEIWDAQQMIAAARASGHRIFAIGVGASPAEGVLRSLAEATGGACEFATPGEALEAAARRMLVRVRQQPWRDVRIDWCTEPVWQTALPTSVFGGDTVIAFAGMTAHATASTVRLVTVDAKGGTTEVARGEADAPCPGDALPRIAAAKRIAAAGDSDALTLAIDYQLMGPQTNCVLVHRRVDADKSSEEAELHRVNSMLAAGWGATASVMPSMSLNCQDRSFPSAWRRGRTSDNTNIRFAMAAPARIAIPGFLDKQSSAYESASLKAIALAVVEHLAHGGHVQGLAVHCRALNMHPEARAALDQAVDLGASEAYAWLLLAHWTNVRRNGLGRSTIAAALQPHLAGLDASLIDKCVKLFDQLLGGYGTDGWNLSRTQRLRRALVRALA